MIQDLRLKWFIAVAVLTLPAAAAQGLVMDTVPVGNVGNADDTHGDGYGGVSYAYSIGKYEVTAGQYTEFLNAVAATDIYGLYNADMWSSTYGCKIQQSGSSGSYGYSVASDWADRPVNYVSFWDAARFANWMHNGQQGPATTEYGAYHDIDDHDNFDRNAGARWVIPTEDEWYKAAYHKNDGVSGNYYLYPTSSDTAPGYVNDAGNLSGTGSPFTDGGTDPGNYATYDGDGGTDGIGSPYYRTEVGEWENSASPYGTFDQGGNVWEWNEAILYGSHRGWRGGSFRYDEGDLRASNDYHSHYPANEDYVVGFRVASVPEPGSVLVWLTVGVVGLIWWRRRR